MAKSTRIAITPENVLANINGNWSSTLWAMGYSDNEMRWNHPNCKKIKDILNGLLKQKKITARYYPAEDDTYTVVRPSKG